MANDSGRTTSSWMETAETPDYGPLDGDAEADVCVVGAGMAGLSAAYELASRGRSVIVLDKGPVGGGESSRTTGHLSDALDEHFHRLEWLHGREGARLAWTSHRAGIERVGHIAKGEGIDCDFERVDGFLFAPPGESPEVIERELEACRRIGRDDVEMVDRAPLPGLDTGPSLRHPEQGQFHVLRYLGGLARAILGRGGRICTGTQVLGVEGGAPCTVSTRGGATIRAGAAIVATNTPISDRYITHVKQAAYRSYVAALEMPEGAATIAQYWDTADPYHYARVQRLDGGGLLLIVGGEDHKVGQDDDPGSRFARLEAWARERVPGLGRVAHRWSGQVFEPADGLSMIGPDPSGGEHVFIVTGDSGHGLTHGAFGGVLLADLISGEANPWADLYDPGRTSLRSLGTYASENLNVARQYAEWLTGGDVDSADRIGPGHGAVIREGLKKVAAYRDESGALHRHSAVCPHLGGIVRFNEVEKSWDCPCHGARFGTDGRVLSGPSPVGLEAVD